MNRTMQSVFVFLILGCLPGGPALRAAETYFKPAPVKLIHDGWMFQEVCSSTQWLRDNIAMLEKVIPGQGINVRFIVPKQFCENNRVETTRLFGAPRWKYEWFQHDIENLKKTKFRKFTDNFLSLAVNPGNVDWFSDADWDTVCNNHRIAARIAKETGMVGLKLDIEEYGNNSMWQFKPENGRTLAETHRKIRQRGQEFGKAIFQEFPDVKLLCYWWLSLARHKNDRFDPEHACYMVAPFVNGVYDVLPPGATIHDGDESCAYRANSMEEFYHLRVDLDRIFPRFIAPENLAKYRAQTKLAPGLYIDPHFSKRGGFWKTALLPDLKELGGARLFKRNLQQAAEVADEYVWMWTERFTWFSCNHPAKPEVLDRIAPGIASQLDLILRPMPCAAAMVKEKKLPNLMKNGDFSRQPEGRQRITCFGEWHGGKGNFQRMVLDGNPVAAAVGVADGCIYQSIRVKSGQMYLVRGSMRGAADGARARLSVNWKRADGERYPDYRRRIHEFGDAAKDQWSKVEFVVTVPEKAFYLEVMAGVSGGEKHQPVYFDNLEVYQVLD